MAFITAETRSDLIALAVGMLKQAPSNTLLEELIALSVEGGSLADAADHIAKTDAFKAEYPSFQTATQYATELFDNITTGGTVTAEIRTAVIDLATGFLLSGAYSKSGLALAIVDFLSQPAALLNDDFADIAQSVQNRSAAAEYLVVTKELGGLTDAELAAAIASVTSDADTLTAANEAADATADAEAVVPGQTFTLTTGLDTGSAFTGGTGNDSFVTNETSTATTDTLTTGDSLVGGDGTDTLTVSVSGTPAGGVTNGVSTSSIEAINIYNNSTAAYELDAALMKGVTDVYVSGGTFSTIVDDISSIANLHLTSTNVDAEISTTAAAVAGSANEAVILSNGSATVSSITATYDGIETINFIASQNATGSSTKTLTLDSNQLETVNVTGDATANLVVSFVGVETDAQTATFNAADAGAAITANITKGSSDLLSVTMSAYDDTVTLADALTEDATVAGGDGVDTLSISNNIAYAKAADVQAAAGVSGFEKIKLAAGVTVDGRALTSNEDAITSATVAGAATLAGMSIASITQTASGAVTLSLPAEADGEADALTATLYGVGVASELDAAEYESLTIVSSGLAGANSLVMDAEESESLTTVVVAGNREISVDIAGTSLESVNAAALTGTETFTLVADGSESGVTVTASSVRPSDEEGETANDITTGEGDDVITGGAYIDSIAAGDGDNEISAGAGDDTVTAGAGDDTIDGGEGDDTLTTDKGDDVLTGGDGDDTLNAGRGDDVLDGGDGDDIIITGAGTDTVDGGAGNDVIISTNLDSEDVIDGGEGVDILAGGALDAEATLQANAAYADTNGAEEEVYDVANVEVMLIDWNNSEAEAGSDIDFAGADSLATLYLDENFAEADLAAEAVSTANNIGASTVYYRVTDSAGGEGTVSIVGDNQDSMTFRIHGDSEAESSYKFDDIDALTLKSVNADADAEDALVSNAFNGDFEVVDVTSLSVIENATGEVAGAEGTTYSDISVTGGNLETLTISAGDNSSLTIGTVSVGESGEIADDLAISITAGDDSTVDITAIELRDAAEAAIAITTGVGSSLTIDTIGSAEAEGATAALTASVAAGSDLDMGEGGLAFDGTAKFTAGTGSTISIESFGQVGGEGLAVTFVGRGSLLDAEGEALDIGDLKGEVSLNFAGWTEQGEAEDEITYAGEGEELTEVTITGGDYNLVYTMNAAEAEDAQSLTFIGEGAATVDGAESDDTITTDAGADTIDGAGGADVISSGEGADTITGGEGDDEITAGGGDDTIAGEGGADTINAGEGSDTVSGGEGDDVITASGEGENVITGEGGDDDITGGAGVDEIDGGEGADTIDSGDGADVITIASGDSDAEAFDVIVNYDLDAEASDVLTLDSSEGEGALSVVADIVAGELAVGEAADAEDGVDAEDIMAIVTDGVLTIQRNGEGTAEDVAAIDTLAEWLAIADLALAVEDTNGAEAADIDERAVLFEFDGDSYIYTALDDQAEGAAAIAADDLIKLEGVIDVEALATTDADATVLIG